MPLGRLATSQQVKEAVRFFRGRASWDNTTLAVVMRPRLVTNAQAVVVCLDQTHPRWHLHTRALIEVRGSLVFIDCSVPQLYLLFSRPWSRSFALALLLSFHP